MSKINKMLIDASHPEETRVVVVRNGRVEEFDFESASRKPLRGNIYLAKITRVEPSLQAAFVEYGGNRHGFLAFNEIHPDYYQIPMADRMALLEEEAAQEAAEEAEADAHAERLARRRNGRPARDEEARDSGNGRHGRRRRGRQRPASGSAGRHASEAGDDGAEGSIIEVVSGDDYEPETIGGDSTADDSTYDDTRRDSDEGGHSARGDTTDASETASGEVRDATDPGSASDEGDGTVADDRAERSGTDDRHETRAIAMELRGDTIVEAVPGTAREDTAGDDSDDAGGGDDDGLVQVDAAPVEIDVIEPEGAEDIVEEVPQRPRRRMRSYKIQEVIKRRQIVLVQVVKEERGNKGAALTTYLSLAGRYTVLMPNTARGGGISRKITNPGDRKRLKAAAQELDVPEGMGLIVRTAGASREAQEIKRDFEYLLRLWENVRELTLQSTAPTLVYEEGNLIKRSIRDLYDKDIEEVVVAGDVGHREAHDFMRMLSPAQARNVTHYQGHEPLFARFRVEQQLAALFSPQVTLRSGGYIVINQTEALVAIDVNSGKATREYSIEETALQTNLEAAEEVARQVRLRDLAGLIVIDFIDMEEKRNNRAVERRLKDSLRNDRARIQLGRISHFGLMEMSRQRLRTGVVEGSTSQCPHCQGSGIVRSIESIALAVLRGIEDALMNGTRMALVAHTTPQVALYILNAKRGYVTDMEARHGLPITIQGSDKLQGANFTIEKVAAAVEPVRRRSVASPVNMDWGFDEADDNVGDIDTEANDVAEGSERDPANARHQGDQNGEAGRRRRRRRGRRGRRDERRDDGEGREALADDYGAQPVGGYDGEVGGEPGAEDDVAEPTEDGDALDDRQPPAEARADDDRPRGGRRRGRRGGRRGQGGDRADNGERHDRGEQPELQRPDMARAFDAAASGAVLAYLEDGSLAPALTTEGAGTTAGHGDGMTEAAPHRRGEPRHRPTRDVVDAGAKDRPPVETQGDEGRSHANAANGNGEGRRTTENPNVEIAAIAPSAPVQTTAAPGKPEVPLEAVATEPARPRRSTESSDPVIERVVVGTEVAVVEPAPVKRGWWQRKS